MPRRIALLRDAHMLVEEGAQPGDPFGRSILSPLYLLTAVSRVSNEEQTISTCYESKRKIVRALIVLALGDRGRS